MIIDKVSGVGFQVSVGESLFPAVGCVKTAVASELAGEPRFEIFDAGLEHRHLMPQLGNVARQDLSAPALIGQARFYSAHSLGDRVILLLQAFEPSVDLVEVAEHIAAQLGYLPVDLIETLVDLGELPTQELDQLFVLARRHGPMIYPKLRFDARF